MLVLSLQEINLSAANSFLTYFKLFKYMGAIPRMDQLFRYVHDSVLRYMPVCVSTVPCDCACFLFIAGRSGWRRRT
jgi:hypothetical protein